MSETSKPTITISSSFLSLLTVAFIVLKLCKVITWSWWWVLAPIWVPVAITLLIIIVLFVWMLIMTD